MEGVEVEVIENSWEVVVGVFASIDEFIVGLWGWRVRDVGIRKGYGCRVGYSFFC